MEEDMRPDKEPGEHIKEKSPETMEPKTEINVHEKLIPEKEPTKETPEEKSEEEDE